MLDDIAATLEKSLDIEAITAAELSALAKQYLGRDRVSCVTVLPKS